MPEKQLKQNQTVYATILWTCIWLSIIFLISRLLSILFDGLPLKEWDNIICIDYPNGVSTWVVLKRINNYMWVDFHWQGEEETFINECERIKDK